jgi:glutaconate CoA-transferase, subunit B
VSAAGADRALLISVVARLLEGCRHVAVGVSSPVQGAGALLARELSGGSMRLTVLGSRRHNFFTSGGLETFDLAAQGRIDAFFLSGGQIDGQGNVNLVGTGDYPDTRVRWSGSFGSPYMYFLVPRVILFREEHTRRVMVPRVDFVSAPGTSAPGVYRRGGPAALVTGLCLFAFDRTRARFRLESVHPGHTVEEVRDCTGFDFDIPDRVGVTPAADPNHLALLRGTVLEGIGETYPKFARELAATL